MFFEALKSTLASETPTHSEREGRGEKISNGPALLSPYPSSIPSSLHPVEKPSLWLQLVVFWCGRMHPDYCLFASC